MRDKVAVVTGGTRGIGLSVARRLLAEGARVYICGRNPEYLKSALELLRQETNGAAAGIVANVRRYEDCRKVVQGAAERFGGLDILVNNAGVGYFKSADQVTPEEWDTTIETNLSGVFYCCHEAIPLMRKRGGGYIFNISSLAGSHPFPRGIAYTASKFGLNGFSEALMESVRQDGIRVSYILPGDVDSDFGGVPGSGHHADWKLTGEDIAEAVVDLYKFPSTALASRIEIRPSRRPKPDLATLLSIAYNRIFRS